MPDFNIGFAIFPGITQLDFTGPLQVLNRMPDVKTHIVAKSLDPVPSDCGLSLVPTTTFQDCPRQDLICVPGGFGVVKAMTDRETVDHSKALPDERRMIAPAPPDFCILFLHIHINV